MKTYYRIEQGGRVNKRNWNNPPFGWHSTLTSALKDKIRYKKDIIKEELLELRKLRLMLRRSK